MKLRLRKAVWALVVLMTLASCEKMAVDETKKGDNDQPAVVSDANLILKVVVGTRAETAPWKTLNFVVYQNGAKVQAVTQKEGDTAFGEVGMQLTPGTYQVMVLAHSSTSNPTLSNPENVKFTNADGFSDTFAAYQTIEVKAAAETHEMVMERMTAMVRFKTRDAKPAEAKRVKFYYEGGSGAINVLTGYGVDKSKQTVFVDMPDSLTGKPLQFSLYTFPRTDSEVLRLAVSMFTADETLIKYPGTDEGTRTFTNIPIKRNQITECSGYFFTEGSQGNGESGDDNGDQHSTGNGDEPAANTATSFLVVVNPEWGDVVEYAY